MNRFKKAAIEILKESKEPLHYKDITKIAIAKSLIKTGGATPNATMSAQITIDIKNKKEKSDFIRVKRGVYALKSKQEEINEDLEEKNKEKKVAAIEVKGETKNGKGRRRAG